MNKPERDWWKLIMLHGYSLKCLIQICVHCRLTVVMRAISALQQSPNLSHCCCWPPCAIKNGLFLQTWPFSLKYFFWRSDIFYEGAFEKSLYRKSHFPLLCKAFLMDILLNYPHPSLWKAIWQYRKYQDVSIAWGSWGKVQMWLRVSCLELKFTVTVVDTYQGVYQKSPLWRHNSYLCQVTPPIHSGN